MIVIRALEVWRHFLGVWDTSPSTYTTKNKKMKYTEAPKQYFDFVVNLNVLK